MALAAVALLPVMGEKPGRLRGKHFARRGWESFCVEIVSYLGGREGDMGKRTKRLNDRLPRSVILDSVSESAGAGVSLSAAGLGSVGGAGGVDAAASSSSSSPSWAESSRFTSSATSELSLTPVLEAPGSVEQRPDSSSGVSGLSSQQVRKGKGKGKEGRKRHTITPRQSGTNNRTLHPQRNLQMSHLRDIDPKRQFWLRIRCHRDTGRQRLEVEIRIEYTPVEFRRRTLRRVTDIRHHGRGVRHRSRETECHAGGTGERGADADFVGDDGTEAEDARDDDAGVGDRSFEEFDCFLEGIGGAEGSGDGCVELEFGNKILRGGGEGEVLEFEARDGEAADGLERAGDVALGAGEGEP